MIRTLQQGLKAGAVLAALVVLAIFFDVAVARAADRAPDQILAGVLTGAAHETYTELPFKVPPGIERITVEFSYGGREQKSVIDLGLRDPQRFRGWSGGNKSRFTVSTSDATPSYLPGAMPAGEWKLILGAPNIRKDARADYVAKIWLDRAEAPFAGFGAQPIVSGERWWRGDLHMHTGHSDGSCKSRKGVTVPCPVFKTLDAAVSRGLDFVALTDHNTTSHFEALRELAPYYDDLLVMPGREITTFYGHANLLGPTDFVDFQLGGPRAPGLADIQKAAEASGGLLSINHPGLPSGELCMGCGWTAPNTDYSRIAAVEVINGGTTQPPLSGMAFWEKRLNEGLRIAAIGGSDNHDATLDPAKAPAIGVPTTVVRAGELSQAAILAAIRAGHVFIDVAGSRDRLLEVTARAGGAQAQMGDSLRAPAGARVEFSVRVVGVPGGRVVISGDGPAPAGDLALSSADQTLAVEMVADGRPRWLRIDVRDAGGKLALVGNPIYLRP
ncbi:CehA/McbA family metallohydrolase [Phenylobacterium sp.]|uniref:CehA/McbA family metallohydrolase n=1 Tax=Phenylobacterium sp. TaxID=1871053 RepID=UPI0035AEF0C2